MAEDSPVMPPVSAVRRLRLREGDVLLVEVPEEVSEPVLACIKATVEREFPGHRALVLSGGITIRPINPEPDTVTHG